MNISTEMIGVISGLLSSITFLPQIMHLLRNRSAKDISSGTDLIILFSELGWLFYGILTESPAIIITTIIACFSALIILCLKLKYNGLLRWTLPQNSSAHYGPNS